MRNSTSIATSAIAIAIGLGGIAMTQIAFGTKKMATGLAATESIPIASGFSAQKSLLSQPLYNEEGLKVGTVEDLIFASNKTMTHVIVGTGGFIGLGRHYVALPLQKIQGRKGKLVLPGATKAYMTSLPAFDYANSTVGQDQFLAESAQHFETDTTKVAGLRRQAGAAATETTDHSSCESAPCTLK